MNTFKSFLIINPFGIGDVLFSTPLIRNINKNFPDSRIYYLCNRKTYPVLKGHPLIKKAFVYERDDFVSLLKKSKWQWFKAFRGFIVEIKKERIDVCLDLSLNTQYGFFAWLAGIRNRYGLDYKKRCRFLTRRIGIEGYTDKHVAEYYLDVLRFFNMPVEVCGMEVFADPDSKNWVKSFLNSNRITDRDLIIAVAPCGGAAFGKDAGIKRWPSENFSMLIDCLIKEFKAKIFILAGPTEKKEVGQIMSRISEKGSCFEFTDCSLERLIALVDACGLFIGNDTGPLRFADALNKKIIAFFGPVDEKVYGPYPYDNKRTTVLKIDLSCRPCYRKFRLLECHNNMKCLTDITVERVLMAVKGHLSVQDRPVAD